MCIVSLYYTISCIIIIICVNYLGNISDLFIIYVYYIDIRELALKIYLHVNPRSDEFGRFIDPSALTSGIINAGRWRSG